MAKLTSSERNSLPSSSFAGPGRSYPIEDPEHGRKAIQLGARSVKAGNLSSSEYSHIKSEVHSKFPNIGKRKSGGLNNLP